LESGRKKDGNKKCQETWETTLEHAGKLSYQRSTVSDPKKENPPTGMVAAER
jgi:hypothetical protein